MQRSLPVGTLWLLATAMVCGAVVMAVELLGARMLSVGYGASMSVWAAMISVTLLSLAVGYFLGGWLSDRFPRPVLLHSIVTVAGVLVAGCPYARPVLKLCYDAMGLNAGALASSAIVFCLPLGLLGMVGPFVIRLLCEGRQRVGVTAGGVYAISTIGSVAGTLLTGLWLIPEFGTPAGFRIAAAAAAATGGLGLIALLGRRGAAVLLVPAALPFFPDPTPQVGRTYTAPDGDRVVVEAVRDTAHGRIVVLHKGRYKLLVVNGIVQTGIPTDLPHLQKGQCLANCYFQELLPYLVDDPSAASALIIGLAGGMTASLLAHYEMDVDSVDLDAEVIHTARQHFSFVGRAVAADGRRFMEDCSKQYDFCVIDTYSGDVFPFYLASVEAFQAAKNVLNRNGVLAMNFIGSPTGRAFACVHATLRRVFAHVLAIKGEPSDDVQTITIFASSRPIEFNSGWLDHLGDFTGVDPIAEKIERLTVTPTRSDARVLTDEHNPIDFIRAGEALCWRKRTAENIGEEALF